jgi:hypothetical protein
MNSINEKIRIHNKSDINDCRMITLDRHEHANGNLTAINNGVELPFDLQRTFYIYDVPGGAERYTGMQPAQLNEVWAAFARTYFGNPSADELHAIEAKLQFHALLRSMGAIGFSDTVPDEKRAERAMFLNNVFLQGYEVFGPKA